jgi:hypothetical protein
MSAPSPFQIQQSRLVGREGFEPSTPGLKVRSSTAELTARLCKYRRRLETCQTLGKETPHSAE